MSDCLTHPLLEPLLNEATPAEIRCAIASVMAKHPEMADRLEQIIERPAQTVWIHAYHHGTSVSKLNAEFRLVRVAIRQEIHAMRSESVDYAGEQQTLFESGLHVLDLPDRGPVMEVHSAERDARERQLADLLDRMGQSVDLDLSNAERFVLVAALVDQPTALAYARDDYDLPDITEDDVTSLYADLRARRAEGRW